MLKRPAPGRAPGDERAVLLPLATCPYRRLGVRQAPDLAPRLLRRDLRLKFLEKAGGLHVFVKRAGFKLRHPDADQVARDVGAWPAREGSRLRDIPEQPVA